MKKTILIVLILILCVSFVGAYCNESWVVEHTNESEASADYNISITRTCTDEMDKSGSIAIVIFILAISFALFILPFKKRLANGEIADLTLKRCCWLLAIYLMMLNSAMVATIAEGTGIALTSELLNIYMWLFGWGGYLFMSFLIFKTIVDIIQIHFMNKKKKRMGDDE